VNRKEKLVTEALGDGDGELYARLAAAHARRRRGIRRLSVAAAASLTAIAALFVARQPASQPAAFALPPSPSVEIISDEELLVQLKGQPVLLLKDQTGITGVVFLAEKPADETL